jgi:glycosyltransferase involved in cell wall biosynthesis
VVIYPPVDTTVILNAVKNLYPSAKPQDDKKYYLSVSRLVRGKGVEEIIKACGELGLRLKIIGVGPELNNLKSLATNYKLPATIEFIGQIADEKLPEIYANALATIVASEEEDFGIVPVESMAAGTPVIALKAGGFLETVVAGKTGEFFEKGDLGKVLESFDPKKYQAEDCIKQAEKFSKERFKKEILKLIDK